MVREAPSRPRAELAQDPLPLMRILPIPSSSSPHLRSLCLRGSLALAALCLAALLSVSTAMAVLIPTGDGSGNTTPPSADPGFANVGKVNGFSGVYVRNGWILTADHVGENPIILGGVTYQPIPGSSIRFQNPDLTFADLRAFKLATIPPLPDLLIANNAPSLNTQVMLIGNGRNRGTATQWMGIDGWSWEPDRTIRWGTNQIGLTNNVSLNTHSFWTYFDEIQGGPPGQHEADIVNGDSGGAAFTGSGPSAELIGILFARATFENQPNSTSLYGNGGLIVDLFEYRNDILGVIDQPDCDDGLDDDGDGLTDYPLDPGCSSLTDTSERELTLACDNGLDDDNDGTIDLGDGGCTDPADISERGSAAECDNGIDDDLDTLFDFPNDTGCLHPTQLIEAPEPGFGLMSGLGAMTLAFTSNLRRKRCTGRSPRWQWRAV